MREVTVHTIISAPREEIFDFVSDLAGRPAFSDHYMEDFRLARAMPVGKGAAARFKLRNQWVGLTIREADRPRRIIEDLRIGRQGRSRGVVVWDFSRESAGLTRVELTTYSEPKTMVDRFRERGSAGYLKRKTRKALERLRAIFEGEVEGPLKRVTIAGYEPAKSPRFGAHSGMDPARAEPGEPA